MQTLTQLQLEILPDVQSESWQVAQSCTTVTAQWNTYLNQVSLSTFLPWLRSHYAPQASLHPSLWNFVNGTAITLGDRLNNKRLILIPDKTIDTSELRIPQEWIDLTNWAGDYYLAVQVNPDEGWVRVWGYTTHEQIKAIATYDERDRTYCLDAQDLIQDLTVLWVVRQLNPTEVTQAAIAPLPTIQPAQADNLLQRLTNPALLQARLEVPFALWGALLERADWRQRLSGSTSRRVQLGQWLQNVFEEGWQSLESLLGRDEFAVNLRQVELSEAAVRRVKLLNLSDRALLLLVTLEPEADGRIGVRSQLRSRDASFNLPANLQLSLISSMGEMIQSVQSRPQDDVIQLRRFRSALGTQFSLQVAIDDTVITEDFQL
ncbi:DUF1822 family protein [Phormidesmis sp. 146-12]